MIDMDTIDIMELDINLFVDISMQELDRIIYDDDLELENLEV